MFCLPKMISHNEYKAASVSKSPINAVKPATAAHTYTHMKKFPSARLKHPPMLISSLKVYTAQIDLNSQWSALNFQK